MKKILYTIILTGIFSGILFLETKAESNQDFGTWTGFTLTKKFTPDLSVRLRQEIRTRENASQIQKGLADIGVRYRINKYVRFAFHYRYNHNVRRDFEYSSRHRLNADMVFRYKMKPVVFNYRLRYQHQYRDILTSENGLFPREFIRHKVQAHLNLNSRWSPYIASEIFHTVDPIPDMTLVQHRYRLGVAYEINRHNNISVYYMYRAKENIRIPRDDYILGIRLNVFI